MSTDEDPGWAEYYEASANDPPRALLVRAVGLQPAPGFALDLGCGAGTGTRYLLERGYTVTAVDADAGAIRRLRRIGSDRLQAMQCRFDAFPFAPDRYDLISAQLALPFNPPPTFPAMFARLRASLAPGGIFAGDLFGVRDAWNTPESGMTFHTRAEVQALLVGLDVIELAELDEEVDLADGTRHRAHAFDIIARRLS